MATFLTTRGVASDLEQIFIGAEKFLHIVTPYLQFSETLYERLVETTEKGILTNIVCRDKNNLTNREEKKLVDLNCNIFFEKNLHGKCYANEHSALITSMNLYHFSEVNNKELGVLLSAVDDDLAYQKCIKEVNSIIRNSEPYKKNIHLTGKTLTVTDRTFEEYNSKWLECLHKTFPSTVFINDAGITRAKAFPSQHVDFSTNNGFARFDFNDNYDLLKAARNDKKYLWEQILKEYRFYWSQPQTMSLYHAKNIDFRNTDAEIQYCLHGLNKLIRLIKELPIQ